MKVTLFMAISLNGIIADKNGNEDFLSHVNWNSFVEKTTQIGNLVVGRKTYEAVKDWGGDYGFDNLSEIDRVIVSTQSEFAVDGYTVASSPDDAVATLAKKGHDQVLVTGGSTINSAFVKDGLVDEIVLNIEPVIIGEGLPLFAPETFETTLDFVEAKQLEDGIQQVTYLVRK